MLPFGNSICLPEHLGCCYDPLGKLIPAWWLKSFLQRQQTDCLNNPVHCGLTVLQVLPCLGSLLALEIPAESSELGVGGACQEGPAPTGAFYVVIITATFQPFSSNPDDSAL